MYLLPVQRIILKILPEERVSIIINTIELFLVNDIQTHPPQKNQIRFLIQNDAQCSQSYEKTIFRF